MSFSFSRDRTAEIRGDNQDSSYQTTSADDGFGPRRTPAGYDTNGLSRPTTTSSSRYNTPRRTYSNTQEPVDHQSYEMTSPRNPIDTSTMSGFFGEIEDLKSDIATVGTNIQEIQSLHESALSVTSVSQSKNYASQLAALKNETQQRNNDIKNRLKSLEGTNGKYRSNDSDGKIRKTQTDALRKRFLGTIQEYQDMERMYDQRYRQRIERQIRIVKPEATSEEVEDIIDSDQSSQVFTQSLMQAGRSSQARAVLNEVQDRHQDIKRIEKTIVELHQLFMDMQMLVEQQGETLDQVEHNAEDTNANMEQGNQFIARAIKSARATRRKKWWCLGICIVLAVVIAILVWWFGFNHVGLNGNPAHKSEETPTSTPTASST
ncbi:t-SNARE [Chlamydoabsidia padenii]|nr:t-SNARE [Chlamydoabsidia padenii]